jgi:hypothetical protein
MNIPQVQTTFNAISNQYTFGRSVWINFC